MMAERVTKREIIEAVVSKIPADLRAKAREALEKIPEDIIKEIWKRKKEWGEDLLKYYAETEATLEITPVREGIGRRYIHPHRPPAKGKAYAVVKLAPFVSGYSYPSAPRKERGEVMRLLNELGNTLTASRAELNPEAEEGIVDKLSIAHEVVCQVIGEYLMGMLRRLIGDVDAFHGVVGGLYYPDLFKKLVELYEIEKKAIAEKKKVGGTITNVLVNLFQDARDIYSTLEVGETLKCSEVWKKLYEQRKRPITRLIYG